MIAKTPLYAEHIKSGAHMVNFHGWELPLHYGSQLEEHHAVRKHAGMFDVSHMTIVDILGAGGRQYLRKLLANDVDKLAHIGKAMYTCMCNEHGGIIDDLIVYQRSPDKYRLILNSATCARDLAWLQKKSDGFSIGIQVRNELAMIAVQGPEALAQLSKVLTPAQNDNICTLAPFSCAESEPYFFARTGYTGEDGLEIVAPAEHIVSLWQALLHEGVKPCGLGARDTLRLEAGYLLHGQDIDETISPLESGLAWTIKFEPSDRNFIGMGALQSQQLQGINRKLVGLVLDGPGIMRAGQKVLIGSQEGIITSGSYSPILNKSIALARVPTDVTGMAEVMIRDKMIPARMGQPRFISAQQIIWS